MAPAAATAPSPTDGRATFTLRKAISVDFSSAIPQEVARLPRGLHARCICFHPSRPVLAVGLERCVGEYDVLSGAKLGCTHFVGVPVAMAYTPDGGSIAVLLERSLLFFAERMRTTIRGALWNAPNDRKKSTKLKLDYKKPIVGLECSPSGKELFVAYADLTVCAYDTASQSLVFNPISLGSKESRGPMANGVINISVHPYIPSACLCTAAFSNGRLGVWEVLPGKQASRLGQAELPDVTDVVGVGLNRPGRAVVAVTYSSSSNSYNAYAWEITMDSNSREAKLVAATMEPRDITSLTLSSKSETELIRNSFTPEYAQFWLQSPSWAGTAIQGNADPAIRSAVISPYDGSIALQLWPPPLKLQSKLIGELNPDEAASARILLTAPILQATLSSKAPESKTVGIMHTPIGFWTGASRSKPLVFSRPLRYLEGTNLQARSANGQLECISLPLTDTSGARIEPRHLIESRALQAILIFFFSKSLSQADGNETDTAVQSWQFTCLFFDSPNQGNALPLHFLLSSPVLKPQKHAAPATWFLPGKDGSFIGCDDSHFAILESNLQFVAVYLTENMRELRPPMCRVRFDSLDGLYGGPLAQSSLARKENDEDSSEHEDDLLGSMDEPSKSEVVGEVLWMAPGRLLCLGDLPVSIAGARTDDGIPLAEMPKCKHSLQLEAAEWILQVSWQILSDGQTASTECHSAGAILTNLRLLVVSPTLQILMENRPSHFRGLAAPITSCLWLGPALIFMSASGQVCIMSWDGAALPLCSVADMPPPPVIAGALGDRLLLLRDTGEKVEVCSRSISLFQPLAIAWASLAGRGFLPGGVARMRSALRSLVSEYDPTVVDRNLLASLAVSGAADLGAELADSLPQSEASVLTACHAAAANWGRAADSTMSEFQRSIHYPKPPPKGSPLWQKITVIARAAAAHGQYDVAKRMFEASGDIRSLLLLAVLSGDFEMLRSYSTSRFPGNSYCSPSEVNEVTNLASALIQANEASYQNRPAGGHAWLLRRVLPEGNVNGEAWDIAPPGATPPMQMTASQDFAEAGRIQPLPKLSIVDYLGLSGSAELPVIPSKGARPADSTKDDGGFQEFGFDDETESQGRGEDAQEAARNAFQMQDDTGFESSDDESSDSGSVSGAEIGRQRLQIKIRAAAPSESTQVDSGALKAAAMGLTLAPPGQFKLKRTNTNDDSMSTDDSFDSSHQSSPKRESPEPFRMAAQQQQPVPFSLGLQPPPKPVAPSPIPVVSAAQLQHPPIPPPAPGSSPTNSLALFKSGISEMEKGSWEAAIALFSDAIDRAASEGASDYAKKQQRLGLMSQYLAAVQLLQYAREAVSGTAPTDNSFEIRARLFRFASALKLEAKHSMMLKQSSVQRNMEVCNFGYSLGVLEDLVAMASESNTPPERTAKLRQNIDECVKRGGGDASVLEDEDCSVFSEIVGGASSSEEVKALVRQLYEG